MKHAIVPHDEWIAARKRLLAEEKTLNQQRDELSRRRRELPWERVDKSYVFDGPDGKESLSDLFAGRKPADRLPFHVRSRLGCGLQELLVLGGQFQRHRR